MIEDKKQYNLDDEYKFESKYSTEDNFSLNNFELDSKGQNTKKAENFSTYEKQDKSQESSENFKEKISDLISNIDKFKLSLEKISDMPISSSTTKKEKVYGVDKNELQKKINSLKNLDNNYRKIFLSKDEKEKSKKYKNIEPDPSNINKLYFFKTVSILPSIFIILFSVFVLLQKYFVSNVSSFSNLNLYKYPFEIVIFVFTSYYIIKKRNQLPSLAGLICALIGFQSGVFIALIKLFWYRQMWNIFYLSLEAIFLCLTGLVIGLISSAIFFENKIYKS